MIGRGAGAAGAVQCQRRRARAVVEADGAESRETLVRGSTNGPEAWPVRSPWGWKTLGLPWSMRKMKHLLFVQRWKSLQLRRAERTDGGWVLCCFCRSCSDSACV